MYKEFESWLDTTIEKGLPVGKGLCFNIYDDGNYSWSIDVIISSSFDPDDDDWATDVVFSSEDAFSFRQVAEWDDVLEDAIQDMLRYLDEGKYADDLKERYTGISTGFVDGDLEHLYIRE
ncbi:hypothetical protein [Butyrivibrio fibrisolvens]|jgi:hypothetical protein|uniref:hypothetical protein n=1 Tax=Butyrivibrio fibrisolvens TaxID=831 RepID=UPI0020BE587A|nr:hypothetical protein [Butyrivibrio fibrisolvens]